MDRHDDLDPQLDALLTRTTASPSVDFESSLERRLFPAGERRVRARRFAGLAVASGGLAAVVVAAGLAGSGPLANHGGTAAKAKPGCTTVYVAKVQPVGQVVKRGDGSVTVETTRRPVFHAEQRCR